MRDIPHRYTPGIPTLVIYMSPWVHLVGSLPAVYMPYLPLPGLVHVDGLLGTAVLAEGPQGVGRSPRGVPKGVF